MNIQKILLSSVLIWIVSTLFAWLTCGWLFNWVYQIEPIIWLTPEVMMSANNMIASNIIGIFMSIIFVSVYAWLHGNFPGKTNIRKGLNYGFMVWLVGALAGMVGMPFYMTIAWTVVIYWLVQALVVSLIKGAIVGAIYKD